MSRDEKGTDGTLSPEIKTLTAEEAVMAYGLAQIAAKWAFNVFPTLWLDSTPEDLAGDWFAEKSRYLATFDPYFILCHSSSGGSKAVGDHQNQK
jgi:hypothetical protein